MSPILVVVGGRDGPTPDDGVALVENGGLTACDPERRLVELESETTNKRRDTRRDGR
jgi:hypothetical protein